MIIQRDGHALFCFIFIERIQFMQRGKLFLVPTWISDEKINTIPEQTLLIIRELKFYVAERAKTARRFLKHCHLPFPIQEIEMVEMDKHGDQLSDSTWLEWIKAGHDVGIISESGMPGIADPGKKYVIEAHRNEVRVIPLTGPSSIFLALAASGLNGQSFVFHGYLPIKDHELKPRLQKLAKSAEKNQSQIFIEAPYRNKRLLSNLVKYLPDYLKLTIAMDVSGNSEYIKTKSIKAWKSNLPELDKIPCIFLIGK